MKLCVNLTQEDHEALMQLSSSCCLIIALLFFCFSSLVVSLVNVIVFTRPRMLRNEMNLLLATLEFANLILSVSHIPLLVVHVLGHRISRSVVVYIYVLVVQIVWVVVFFIIWITALVSGWRYLAVAHPLRARTWLRRSRAVTAILFLIVFCLILAAVQFLGFRFEYWNPKKNCTVVLLPDIYETIWSSWTTSQRVVWARIYVALNKIYYVVPVVCFLLSHSLLIRKLCQRRAVQRKLQEVLYDRRETRSNIILAVLLFTFLVAYAAPCLLVARTSLVDYEKLVPLPWEETFWEFIPGFVVNTVSFGGYYYMSSTFKDTFLEMVRGTRLFKKISYLFCGRRSRAVVPTVSLQMTEISRT